MALVFEALDNEFAAATGGNVNSGPGTSTFDYPPNSTTKLTITAKPGDPDPRLFEVGDVYEVTFEGNGGGTITNAVVVRSDAAPGGGGAIVFEGVDGNGDLTQVIWTPGFDLENWYWTNYSPPNPPGFYTTDQNSAYDHTFVCFAAETRVQTPRGPIAVGALRVNDLVETLDHGPQVLRYVSVQRVEGQGLAAPVVFAPGSIGNTHALRLSQQHRVMLSGAMTELLFGVPEVLVPAKAMIDEKSVKIKPCRQVIYVHLGFDRHEILIAEGGAPCESLFEVPGTLGGWQDGLCPRGVAARPILTWQEARCLTTAMDRPMAVQVP